MGSIQLGGLATGLDTASLISQMMAVERQPVTALQTKKVKLQAVSTAFLDLNSKLTALKSSATALADPATFFPRSVTSSDASVAVATAGSGTARGTFSLTVSGLARGSLAAATSTRAKVTDTITAGTGTFEFKLGANGAVVSVAVDATTTLDQLVKAINDKNAGVKASAINTGNSTTPAYKLTLASTGTGEANDIVIVHDDTALAIANTRGARDAEFAIAGIGDFKRATNTFSDVLDGVTITLMASSGDTDLSIAPDNGALQSKIQAMVDGYNDVVNAIATQGQTTTGSDGAVQLGAFTGDVVPQVIRRGLASVIATSVPGALGRLAEIGITTQKDGTLKLDTAKLQQALTSNSQAVSDLVAGTSSRDGIADLLVTKLDAITKSVTGTIAARRDGLTNQITDIGKQIDAMQTRLDKSEAMLRKKFNDLELLVSRIQSTGNSLMAQLAQLNNQTNTSSSR